MLVPSIYWQIQFFMPGRNILRSIFDFVREWVAQKLVDIRLSALVMKWPTVLLNPWRPN
jgi:hypothetical protein